MSTTPSNKTPSRTPSRRLVHTPLDRSATRDLINSVRRGTPASGGQRNNAPTPHAKAARRALNQRRTAMFTPGKKRRRSLMQQRETPMGILRNLSKVLAPASQPIPSSSSSPQDKSTIAPIREDEDDDLYDDDDDDLPIEPTLTLPLDDWDNDSDDDPRPPRLSQVDDGNLTVQSIELPRRFANEPSVSRLSRGSIGSMGSLEMPDIDNDTSEEIGQQSDFFPGLLDDIRERNLDEDEPSLEPIEMDQTGRLPFGRDSGFDFEIPVGIGDQTTFVMSEPAADAPQTSPIVDQSVAEAAADEVRNEGMEGVVIEGSDSDVGGPDVGGPDFDNEDLDENNWGFDDQGGFDDHSSIIEDDGARPEIEPEHHHSTRTKSAFKPQKKKKRISKYGVEYPALPSSFVKRVAQTALQSSGVGNQRISAETLEALSQASEWFFEQLGDDLGAYADHAKRKTIEESDVLTLMKRQRQIGSRSTVFSLAQKYLPRELIQELRMPVPQPAKKRRAKRVQDDGEEDVTENT